MLPDFFFFLFLLCFSVDALSSTFNGDCCKMSPTVLFIPTAQATIFEHIFHASSFHNVVDDFLSRLCHVTQNLFAHLFCVQCDKRGDESSETASGGCKCESTLITTTHEHQQWSHIATILVCVLDFVQPPTGVATVRHSLRDNRLEMLMNQTSASLL